MDNLHMTVSGNMVSVDWEKDGARFYVWLQIDREAYQDSRRHGVPVSPYAVRVDGKRCDRVLYKNPPKGVERRGPGYFKTRYLDATANANSRMVREALEAAERLGLYQQELAAKDAAEHAEQEARWDANADAAKRALEQLVAEGVLGCGLIQQYLDGADRDSLARLYCIVQQTNARP